MGMKQQTFEQVIVDLCIGRARTYSCCVADMTLLLCTPPPPLHTCWLSCCHSHVACDVTVMLQMTIHCAVLKEKGIAEIPHDL